MPECPPGTHSMFDFCPSDCNEPITAREILEGYGLPDGVVDEALVAHAYELAERIRADVGHMTYGSATDYANRHADLIDPEAP